MSSSWKSLFKSNQIKSNQIKSLLLSHHHSTSALVSEILMSVLQTVQKNNRQFTYGQTVQKNNKQFTYGQTVQKNNKQCTYGQTVQKKLHWSIYSAPDSAKKNNNNLHMDRQCKKKQQQFTYGQTVQKTTAIYIWTVHIYRLYRRQCAKYTYIYSVHIVYTIETYSIINDTLYTVCTHPHYVQYT